MFERFMICIVSFHMVCLLRYTASFTIHCVVYDTLRRLRYTPSFTIHSVVYDTLRPAPNLSNICIIFYFFTPHLAFIPAPIPAFIFCISCVYPVYILCISCVYPVYILCISGVHPAPIPFYIFGLILPSVLSYRGFLNKSCARDIPLLFPFLLLSFIDVREIYKLHCILSYCVSFTIHCVRCSSFLYPGVYPLCILSFIRRAPGTHSVLHLRSNLTFGLILPRILEQVLCPRYSTFLSFLLLYNYDVREIYKLHCTLSYCVSFTIHYIRRAPGTQSVLHLRSNLTFGTILPRILEQVLCPRYSTFISIFITFIYGCSRDL